MNRFFDKRGITLVETIVAVTVLVTAIAGPLTLAAASLRASRDARNNLIATHLAEEAIEVVHNIRDNNITNYPAGSWLTNVVPNCTATECIVDITKQDASFVWASDALAPCSPCSGVDTLYYNPSTGLYRQSANPLGSPWEATPFHRVVRVTGVDDAANPLRQARVSASVKYLGYGNVEKSITIEDDLYNWFPPLR